MSLGDTSPRVWKKRRRMYFLEVVEQPRALGIPFVKPTDLPSSSSHIVGETSTVEKETYPSLLLINYHGPVTLVWYLVADEVLYPHPYVLEGVHCRNGVCTQTVLAKGQIISFPELYVRSVNKEDVQKTLERRLLTLETHLPGTEFKLKDATEYNLSCVRICFQVLLPDRNERPQNMSVLTKSLHSKEPFLQKEPCILSISQCKGSVLGREELTLRVTNLKTDDVIVFFHCESIAPRSSWQAFAEVISISRQTAKPVDIVVKTPPYPDQQISEPQTVAVQIRLMDNSLSNTMKYTYMYTPKAKGTTGFERRVKLKEPIYARYFTCLGASADVNPVLKMPEDNGDVSSQATVRDRMYVYKREEPRTEKKGKPHMKVNAGCQTKKRYLGLERSLQDGYDSEEELGISDGRLDYDRLERYKSLMMESESPSHVSRTNGTATHSLSDIGSLQSSKSNQSNSSESTLHEDGVSGSSPYSNSNHMSERDLVRDMSLVNLQSQSPSRLESNSITGGMKDTLNDFQRSSDEALQDRPESSQSNNTEPVDSNWIFGRHKCEFLIKGTTEVKEIVLRSPGASDFPDLTGSNLYPAVVDKAEFPVNVNKEGLVAVKEITTTRFQKKAYSLWCSSEHKNLITISGIIKAARYCLILEFPKEGSLEGYLLKTGPTSLSPEKRWKWIVQAAAAIEHLHKNGLAHQGITMGHCLISADGDLMLNVPANPIQSKTVSGEVAAVMNEEFEGGTADDVLSISVLAQNLLTSCGFPENAAKSLETFWNSCAHEDKSCRPNMQEVLKKLQTYNQLASGSCTVPLLNMVPCHDAAQPDSKDPTCLASYYIDPIPNSPDSGIGATSGSKNSVNNLLYATEKTESVTSRESGISDSSQNNEDSSNILLAESITQGQVETEAANQTDSQEENNKPSGDESPPTETQGLSNSSVDDSMEITVESSEGGHGGSDRQEGGHEQNGREDKGCPSHLRPPRVMKRIDHIGGSLELFNGEISLEIPPGALKEGQAEDITLSVVWNDEHTPPLRLSDLSVAPIVQCGPTGLHFEKLVQLKLPHCAVISDTKRCKTTVHCSQTGEGETPHWNRISEPEDSNLAVECQERRFILSVRHFTSFSVTLDGGEKILAKEIMFVPYGNEISTLQNDQEIRIYLYNCYSSNREQIRQEEQYLGGKQLNAPKAYHILQLPRCTMAVEVEYHDPSWLLQSALTNTFLFRKIWNLQSYDQCHFIWSNKSGSVKFMCRIVAQQHTNDERMLLEISNHVKMPPEILLQQATAQNSTICHDFLPQASETPQPYANSVSSADVGKLSSMTHIDKAEVHIINYTLPPSGLMVLPPGSPPLIPEELKISLCEKLDQTSVVGRDWTKLASDFGYDKYIKFCQSKQSQSPHFSPTSEILKLIDQELKIKTLTDLEKYFRSISREDVACLIAEYQAAHTDENMITSATPNPDDTIDCPFAADQKPMFADLQNSPSPDLIQDISYRAVSFIQEVPDNINQSLEFTNNNHHMNIDLHGTEPCGASHVCTNLTEPMPSYQQPSGSTIQPMANSNERSDSFETPGDVTPSTHASCNMAVDQTDENMKHIGKGIQKMLFRDDVV